MNTSKSYRSLKDKLEHSSVCHKYELVNSETGVNTQAVESSNKILKKHIKNNLVLKRTKDQVF